MSVQTGWGRFTWGRAYWNENSVLATGWGAKAWNDGEWGALSNETVTLTALSSTTSVDSTSTFQDDKPYFSKVSLYALS